MTNKNTHVSVAVNLQTIGDGLGVDGTALVRRLPDYTYAHRFVIGWKRQSMTAMIRNPARMACTKSDRRQVSTCLPTLLFLCALLGCGSDAPSTSMASMAPDKDVTYAASVESFPNPERGFHLGMNLVGDRNVNRIRNRGLSLARSYIRLDNYRNHDLPPEFLLSLSQGFDIPRFSYNFGTGEPDASLDWVKRHLAQIQPLLVDNEDVIAVLQAGFVGAWGEWHHSTNGLDRPENKKAVLDSLLAALPRGRMVQIRYPGDWISFFPTPLDAARAFDGSDHSRVGHHNDCFLANEHDAGTYWPASSKEAFQQYMDQATPYVAVGGETCQVSPEQSRTDCPTALRELARFHWSYLNEDFYAPTVARWQAEGCYDTMARQLGYRLRLVKATIPTQARAGDVFSAQIEIANDGWASPYNARAIQIVFRHRRSKSLTTCALPDDPRRFAADRTNTVMVSLTIPQSTASGTYDVLLGLPDPSPRLSSRPEYAIRMANEGVWEPQTGLNSLLTTIEIVP
jgi:hypothetical protein